MTHIPGPPDRVSVLEDDGTRRNASLSGFFKIGVHPNPMASDLLVFIYCTMDDPDMRVAQVFNGIRTHSLVDPWSLTWTGPSRMDPVEIEKIREKHAHRVSAGFQPTRYVNSFDHPDIFHKFAFPSGHQRLDIQQWVQECHQKAAAINSHV